MRQLTKTTCKQLLRWNILLVTDHTQTLLHRLASDRYTFFFASFLLIFVVARQSSFNQIYAQIIFIRELGDEINSENKKAKTKKAIGILLCVPCVCVCASVLMKTFLEQSRAEQSSTNERRRRCWIGIFSLVSRQLSGWVLYCAPAMNSTLTRK